MGQQPAVVDAPSKYQVRYPIGLSLSARKNSTGGGAPEPEPVVRYPIGHSGAGGALLALADLVTLTLTRTLTRTLTLSPTLTPTPTPTLTLTLTLTRA